MRIVYLYNPKGKIGSDDTEGHIRRGLEAAGHEVIMLPEDQAFDSLKIEADWLLFHKGGPFIHALLSRLKYKKMCWYFDKVWNARVQWMERTLPLVDLMAVTDGDWALEHASPKVKVLHQGCGPFMEVKRAGQVANIGFTGSIYEGREEWHDFMRSTFGDDFTVYSDVFNEALFGLCASVRVLVAPEYPSTPNYWSSRIYLTLGAGGFLIHPRCEALADEYTEGEHYVAYSSREELVQKVDYYLGHEAERERIRQAGMKRTNELFTYAERVKTLIEYAKAN